MKKYSGYALLWIIVTICAIDAWGNSWYKFPVYYDKVDRVVCTPEKVYYRSGTSLFSYNENDDEHYAYTSLNSLTGWEVKKIYSNYAGGYLVVVYDDGNIDLLYDNGDVVNLPDIRDSNLAAGDKAINDVAFSDNLIAVATNFGIVIFDTSLRGVKESGIYNKAVEHISILGNNLCIGIRQDGNNVTLMHAPMDQRHVSMDVFKSLGNFDIGRMKALDDNKLWYIARNGYRLHQIDIDFSADQAVDTDLNKGISYLFIGECKAGPYTYNGAEIFIWKDGQLSSVYIPKGARNNHYALQKDEKMVWGGDVAGLSYYDISTDPVEVLHDKMVYDGALTCGIVGYMRWSADGKRLYVSNIESSAYKVYAKYEALPHYQTTNVIENGFAKDASLWEASADHGLAQNFQAGSKNKRMYGDPTWIIEDPDDSNIYYCGNCHEGLYVCQYDAATDMYQELHKFYSENTPLQPSSSSGTRVQDVNIDPAGNLWVGAMAPPYYCILPADKRKGNIANVAASDWKVCDKLADFDIQQKEFTTLFSRTSNMVLLLGGKANMGVIAIDTKGTYDNPNDDVAKQLTVFTDQDGIQFDTPSRTTYAIEDRRGCIWVGTSDGVYEIPKLANAMSTDFRVRRIKVPRNDGTSLADYLLSGETIYWMSEDPSGRKWIGTENSGLYLVSETGDQILRHYTDENSPLDSKTISTVECDPHSNLVYVGTPSGLFTFMSDSSPVASDFSEILAYPNPVKPDYGGDVTITGLMENTIVKIADTAGRVVYQTRAEGGMAKWPCSNISGSRVKSGVYYVFVSGGENSSHGSVAKIMVIN